MGVIENEHTYAVMLRESADDGSDFTNADADYRRLFLGEDGDLHLKDSAGTVTDVGGGGAPVAVGCKVYNDATQAVNTTSAALTFNQEEYDTDGFHSTVSNTSRITVPSGKAGKYIISAGSFSSAAADWIGFKVNGTTVRGYQSWAAAGAYRSHTIQHSLAVGDYVEAFVSTSTSVNFGHASLLDAQSWFAVALIGS